MRWLLICCIWGFEKMSLLLLGRNTGNQCRTLRPTGIKYSILNNQYSITQFPANKKAALKDSYFIIKIKTRELISFFSAA